jgi:hypothetical protein
MVAAGRDTRPVPADPPLNALPPGQQPRLTVPETADRPAVRVRIVTRGGEHLVEGVAHGWAGDVVYVHWTDPDGYRRIDWFPAGDVTRA